jgi:hypothetical protein
VRRVGQLEVLHHEGGLTLEFQYEDFYAGIRAGNEVFHL